jgi:uncharacterized protein with von Willebrand factor type A (vWA) domain
MIGCLLSSIASLEALDVLVVLLPDDDEALAVCTALEHAAPLLQHMHKRQTAAPQLVVCVRDGRTAARLQEQSAGGAYDLTPVVAGAAVPNLLAEVLHPECHWSHALDNDL